MRKTAATLAAGIVVGVVLARAGSSRTIPEPPLWNQPDPAFQGPPESPFGEIERALEPPFEQLDPSFQDLCGPPTVRRFAPGETVYARQMLDDNLVPAPYCWARGMGRITPWHIKQGTKMQVAWPSYDPLFIIVDIKEGEFAGQRAIIERKNITRIQWLP